MKIGLKVCKTHEISDLEWIGIVDGFMESFNRSASVETKKNFYSNNLFGYSYHVIASNGDGQVVGHTTIMPSYYKVGGNIQIIGLSGGTYILKAYRKNITLLLDMHYFLRKLCIKENVVAIVGVPNSNSLQYTIKVLKKHLLGTLNYYIIPIRISNLFKNKLPSFFNFFSLAISWFYILLCLGFSYLKNNNEKQTPISLDLSQDYLKLRFKTGYDSYIKDDITCYYKIVNEDVGVIAYVMEFNNNGIPDLKSLGHSLWHILISQKVDGIAYIGTLRIRPMFFIRIPKSYEPTKLPLTCEILSTPKGVNDETFILSIDNWKFSLINFDVK